MGSISASRNRSFLMVVLSIRSELCSKMQARMMNQVRNRSKMKMLVKRVPEIRTQDKLNSSLLELIT